MTEELARKTGGPNTVRGKEISSKNALRHGILSPKPVVKGLEREEVWETFREEILVSLAPVGTLELDLAYHAASLLWRRKRVTLYEAHSIMLLMEEVDRDCEKVEAMEEARRYLDLLVDLPSMEEDELLSTEEFLQISVRLATKNNAALFEALQLIDHGEGFKGGFPQWTAGKARRVVDIVAERTGTRSGKLLSEIRSDLSKNVEGLKAEVVLLQMEGFFKSLEKDRAYRERVLPDDKTLEKIQRYEAHLTRQFNQTLHELEALQARRLGGHVPLARLDVQGLAEN